MTSDRQNHADADVCKTFRRNEKYRSSRIFLVFRRSFSLSSNKKIFSNRVIVAVTVTSHVALQTM